MKKRILVITDHMPWGHRSIARAIYDYLKDKKENDYEVNYVEVVADTGLMGEMYKFVYRYFPSSNRLAHRLSKVKQIRENMIEDHIFKNLPRLEKLLKKYQPDLIISTYFLHSHGLAKIREMVPKYKFKLWPVVADPWTTVYGSYVPAADLHLVYDERSEMEAINFGIKKDKILKTGWWVRGQMYEKFDQHQSRLKLGFKDDRPVVFVGGGSLGTSALPKFLPLLMFVKRPVGVIFNAGTDKLSYKMVEEFWKLYRQIRNDEVVQIRNLSWIENMGEVLAACDMVFGKAGPNFLFDTVAAEKPFVSISHIGGQEDGNIDLIVKKKLGWVKENNGSLSEFFFDYLKNPKKYNGKYQETIKAEAESNRRSGEVILKRIKKELGI